MIITRCFKLLSNFKIRLCLYFFSRIVATFFSIITASVFASIITNIYSNITLCWQFFLVLVLAYCATALVKLLQFTLTQSIEKNGRVEIKKKLIAGMLDSYPAYIGFADSSKVQEIVYYDSNNVTTMVFSVLNMVISVFNIVVVGGLLLKIFVMPTVVLTCILLAISFIVRIYSVELKKMNVDLRAETDAHFKLSHDIIRGAKYITISNSKLFQLLRYNNNIDVVKEKTLLCNNKTWRIGYFSSIFDNVCTVVILTFGFFSIASGKIEPNEIVLFLSYSGIYRTNLTSLFEQYSRLQQIVVSVERVFMLQRYFDQKDAESDENTIDNISSITIEQLSFSYGDKKVFDRYSQRFESNIILLEGGNGTGKTTLLNLIAGVQAANSGKILFNDLPMDSLSRAGIRKDISYVPQDDIVFDMSIRDNILCFLGGDAISEKQLLEVCDKVGILHDILALPYGFDTKISEIRDFSYGQKRKVLLARGFLKPSKLLLLDEPLEGLDAVSRELLVRLIEATSREKKVIIATHRHELFSINGCSRITLQANNS